MYIHLHIQLACLSRTTFRMGFINLDNSGLDIPPSFR